MAANVGICALALAGHDLHVTPESCRWVMLVGATPAVLGLAVLAAVPESPRWLAERAAGVPLLASKQCHDPLAEVFRPPLLGRTVLGVLLGAVPLVGTWASGKWLIPWADAAGADMAGTQAVWALGA